MDIDKKLIVQLRRQTGVGIVDCQKALQEADGDFDKALDILRKKGAQKGLKRADHEASEGVISSYIHNNKKVGTLIELACETDFVAKNEDFIALAYDLAMHIASENPLYISENDIEEKVINKEKEIYREQLQAENTPENLMDKIIEGKLQKYFSEVCLLKQKFIKDDSKTIKDLLDENIAKIGEKIEIKRFARYQI
jgi:elongation factor Ts